MANDKITMLKLKRMLQLMDAGRSMNQICSELHMSKRTVHSYKERAEQSEVPLHVLRQMPDEQLNALLQPPSSVPVPDARKAELDARLDHYLAELKRPYITTFQEDAVGFILKCGIRARYLHVNFVCLFP